MRAALALIAIIVLFAEPARSDTVHTITISSPPTVQVWDAEARSQTGVARLTVASNAGFEIHASPVDGTPFRAADLSAAGFRFAVASAGPNAAIVGAPVSTDVAGGVIVYRATARTAVRPGKPASQALTFSAGWDPARLPGGLRLDAHPLKSE